MVRFGSAVGVVVVSVSSVLGVVGCSGADAAPVGTAANALTRVVPEAAGANCASGGQAFEYGIDVNGNDQLDTDEVKGTSFVCNGTPATIKPVVEAIPVGDPRCPNGGTRIRIEGGSVEGSTNEDAVVCNGATGQTGAKGDQGDAGEQGIQGEAGAPGTPAPEPVLGQFLASQIVEGAVLSCGGFTTTTTTVSCSAMKLNGLDVRLAPTEANAICAAVTGKGYSTASGAGVVASPYFSWTSSGWNLVQTGSTSPMQNLVCNR